MVRGREYLHHPPRSLADGQHQRGPVVLVHHRPQEAWSHHDGHHHDGRAPRPARDRSRGAHRRWSAQARCARRRAPAPAHGVDSARDHTFALSLHGRYSAGAVRRSPRASTSIRARFAGIDEPGVRLFLCMAAREVVPGRFLWLDGWRDQNGDGIEREFSACARSEGEVVTALTLLVAPKGDQIYQIAETRGSSVAVCTPKEPAHVAQ